MSFRAIVRFAGIMLLSLPIREVIADEPMKGAPGIPNPFGAGGVLNVSTMAQAAADLRKATEIIERLGISMDAIVSIANAIAASSSEFDPFGYKTAFRTLAEQSRTIQRQQEMIQALQAREIERLRGENKRLKKKRKLPETP